MHIASSPHVCRELFASSHPCTMHRKIILSRHRPKPPFSHLVVSPIQFIRWPWRRVADGDIKANFFLHMYSSPSLLPVTSKSPPSNTGVDTGAGLHVTHGCPTIAI
ncbi:hypothetical protein MAPG_04418 [Magnaporthiopsis poae ATCC 64411]|uniref:Uncharacterized protein n=1 Tax=Magnaporthiopsis poae (strain ATCC 64411 / 73-15) TaxID=644358 RepID=A0A0C4DWN9_MAGP6|nr:hypothetical protein MAPG_04418 [Magnaporthiopsis poae ATCC 64411]